MNLHLTGHHLKITPAIRSHVESKLSKLTSHFDHVIDVHVMMTIEKLMHKVEATVHLAGKDLFCESSSEDMYAAIDELAHKLDRAIIKHKEKTLTHRHDSVSLKSESIE